MNLYGTPLVLFSWVQGFHVIYLVRGAVKERVFLVIEYDIFTDTFCDLFYCDSTFRSGNRWNSTKYTTHNIKRSFLGSLQSRLENRFLFFRIVFDISIYWIKSILLWRNRPFYKNNIYLIEVKLVSDTNLSFLPLRALTCVCFSNFPPL